MDCKKYTCGVFIDHEKAFDILLSKRNYYGIRGVANSWFASYLFKVVHGEIKPSLCKFFIFYFFAFSRTKIFSLSRGAIRF